MKPLAAKRLAERIAGDLFWDGVLNQEAVRLELKHPGKDSGIIHEIAGSGWCKASVVSTIAERLQKEAP